MSYTKSNLSSEKYGYDYVVATTQASINATMKAYLRGLKAEAVTRCYLEVVDENDNGKIIEISIEELKNKTKSTERPNGVDPFSIPSGAKSSASDVQALKDIGFIYGFQAKIGVPAGYAAADIPDVVVLNPGAPGSAYFTLMCKEFTVVELTYPRGVPKWFSAKQETGKAWLFTSKIDLKNFDVDKKHLDILPKEIQNSVKGIDDTAFTIQHMLFDFTSAVPNSIPTISGVEPGTQIYSCLEREFMGKYFAELKKSGQPVLGYSISFKKGQEGTLNTTGIKHQAGAYVDDKGSPVADPTIQQQDVQTYCYLCATEGRTVPNPTQFGWNWIDNSSEAHGVVAINRKTFAYFLAYKIREQIKSCCYTPTVTVYTGADLTTTFSYPLTPGGDAEFTYIPTGETVFTYKWSKHAHDGSGAGEWIGESTVDTSYNASIIFRGNQIIIDQHFIVFFEGRYLLSKTGGNIVNKTITDTITFSVDQNGNFALKSSSTETDNSETPQVSAIESIFLDGFNRLFTDAKGYSKLLSSINFKTISIQEIKNFTFPGGRSFLFKEVCFSDYQDLIAHITYASPEEQQADMLMRSPIRIEEPAQIIST